MTSQRALYGVAVALALVGVVLRVRPLRLVPNASPLSLSPPASLTRHAALAQEDTSTYQAIIAADPFSPTRAPPAARFSPERTADEPEPVPELAVALAREPEASGLHLFGTTVAPSGAIALLASDPGAPDAQMYRVGDRVGGGSVAAITDSTVVITRAGGRLVLRLPSTKDKHP